jgi:thioredoxin
LADVATSTAVQQHLSAVQHSFSAWPRKPHLVGYACRSTDEQTLAMQIDALRAAGCAVIHWDTKVRSRRGFKHALADLKFGDTLVVWKLDRVGRSLPFVSDTLRKHGIALRSLAEHIDTGARGGKMSLDSFLLATAEFQRRTIRERTRRRTRDERTTISERTVAGMKAAKERGTHVGRPSALAGSGLDLARKMLEEGQSQTEVARIMGVSRSTIFRVIAAFAGANHRAESVPKRKPPSKPNAKPSPKVKLRPTIVPHVTTARFRAAVLLSSQPVLVNFCAPWCAASQMLAPVVEKVAREMGDRFTFRTMNPDDSPGIAMRYNVTGMPCLILFDGGQEVNRIVGAVPEITSMLKAHLDMLKLSPAPLSSRREWKRPRPAFAHRTPYRRTARTSRPELEGVFKNPESLRPGSASIEAAESLPEPSPAQDASNVFALYLSRPTKLIRGS